jgi:hypothetical protein
VGAILGSNVTDPVFSLGIGPLLFPITLETVATVRTSLF